MFLSFLLLSESQSPNSLKDGVASLHLSRTEFSEVYVVRSGTEFLKKESREVDMKPI